MFSKDVLLENVHMKIPTGKFVSILSLSKYINGIEELEHATLKGKGEIVGVALLVPSPLGEN